MDFQEIIPISAEKGTNVDRLEAAVNAQLPKSMHFYPEDQITDRSSRFLAAELVREKLMRNLGMKSLTVRRLKSKSSAEMNGESWLFMR